MIITSEAYHDLIQVQSKARKSKNDPTLTDEHTLLKISTKLGSLATSINDTAPDHLILSDIIILADLLRDWFWALESFDSDFKEELTKEQERQICQWGEQHHSRLRWFLIVAEEAGEIAEAIETDAPKGELIMEIIQLSAVLYTWVTARDWFYEPQSPHLTECKNCGNLFETPEGQTIQCPDCKTNHDCFGKRVSN